MEEGLQKVWAEREACRKADEARHAPMEVWREHMRREVADAQRQHQRNTP
jgi:hypothetical protein